MATARKVIMQGILASGASIIRRQLMFNQEIDDYICLKYNVELEELHSLDSKQLHQIRSDNLFEMMEKMK
tara:strand:+ start:261 stop:470 length:210 start_codon:yes stop_codon:yes gene_type:complete